MKYIKTFEKLRLDTQKDLDSNLLKYSRIKESLQLIRELIIKGANVNCRDGRDRTPLIYAASKNFTSAIKLLVENGADVNAEDDDGNTALLYIAGFFTIKSSLKTTIDILIQNDVDLNHTNKAGRDAISMRDGGYFEKYIMEKYPEKYEEYLIKKDAQKYNL
jgi:ankyrin repeat protein